MSSARPGISIIGVTNGRHSKIYKELLLNSAIQGFSVSSLRHYDVGGVTRSPYILIHNIKESGSVREEVYRKLIRKMYAVVQVEDRCAVGCTGSTSDDTVI